jgi:hypothetical protein
LRDSLGYEGVVITDAMAMRAISDNYGFTEAITLAINAGADILLYNWDDDFQGIAWRRFLSTISKQRFPMGPSPGGESKRPTNGFCTSSRILFPRQPSPPAKLLCQIC